MKKQDYSTSITADSTAAQAFNSINNVAAWWSKNMKGHAEKPGDVFTVYFGETFITVKIIELLPYQKIGWQVIDCYKHWLKDKKEWQHTSMLWDIVESTDKTQVNFTHIGLVPGIECYNGCEKAWDFYIKESLFKLLTEKKGMPELA